MRTDEVFPDEANNDNMENQDGQIQHDSPKWETWFVLRIKWVVRDNTNILNRINFMSVSWDLRNIREEGNTYEKNMLHIRWTKFVVQEMATDEVLHDEVIPTFRCWFLLGQGFAISREARSA